MKAILRLGDSFRTYAYIPFPSSADAERWLEENGFESQATPAGRRWVYPGKARLKILNRTEPVAGAIVARVHELTTLEMLEFKPA